MLLLFYAGMEEKLWWLCAVSYQPYLEYVEHFQAVTYRLLFLNFWMHFSVLPSIPLHILWVGILTFIEYLYLMKEVPQFYGDEIPLSLQPCYNPAVRKIYRTKFELLRKSISAIKQTWNKKYIEDISWVRDLSCFIRA